MVDDRPFPSSGQEDYEIPVSIFIIILLIGIVVWGIVIYNRLVRDRNRVRAAWSDIDVQLQRRHDLIPKLVAAVSQYARFERSTLERLTALRSASRKTTDLAKLGEVESAIGSGLRDLLLVVEDYPQLKADASFRDLQRDISAVEDQIQFARRYYNGAVRNLNTRIESFPDLLLAGPLNYRPEDYFELSDTTEREFVLP